MSNQPYDPNQPHHPPYDPNQQPQPYAPYDPYRQDAAPAADAPYGSYDPYGPHASPDVSAHQSPDSSYQGLPPYGGQQAPGAYGQQQAQDPYPQQAQQHWPQGSPGPEDPQQFTQTWHGHTWDTQVHAVQSVPSTTETAYLPSQSYDGPPEQYGSSEQYGAPDPAGTPPPAAPAPAGPAGNAATPPPSAAPEAGPEATPDYGPATTTGNSRITDAQRARAEGRSPVIAPGMQPALLTAGLGVLIAGGAAIGRYGLLVPLVILQALTAAGWFRLNGMWPARQGIALAFAGGLAADIALLAAGRDHGPAAILGTLGIWVLLTLVLQLRSRADADDRMAGLMATAASSALAIVAAGHLAALPDAASVGGVAVAAAMVARALPLPAVGSLLAGVVAAAGAGLLVGLLTGIGSGGALLGVGAGVCALIGHRVASYDYPSRFVHMTAGVALPLAAAAPAVYLLGRVVG